MATLGGFFGLLALIVACLGIFGVMAFQVSRRINEIGVRMALGASRGSIVTLVLREVAVMVVAGMRDWRGGGAEPDGPGGKDDLRRHADAARGVRPGGGGARGGGSRGGMAACPAGIAGGPDDGAATRVNSRGPVPCRL